MLKKIMTVALSATLLLSAMSVGFTATAAYTDDVIYGDINGNGKIDTEDARTALRAASGLSSLSEEQMLKADINRDGIITIFDARQILRAAAGLTQLQPTGSFTGFDGGDIFDTEEEMLNVFNTALNKIKASDNTYAAGFTKTSTDKLNEFVISDIEFIGINIGNSAQKITESIRDMIIAEDDADKVTIIPTGGMDFGAMPIETAPVVSKLTVSDIYGAKASYNSELGEVTITIAIADTETETVGQSSYSKVFNTENMLNESESVMKKLLSTSSFESAMTSSFRNCELTAVIDVATLEVISYTTSYDSETYIAEASMKTGSLTSSLAKIKGLEYKKNHKDVYDNFQWGV